MSKQVMALCSSPAIADKDGNVGANAHFFLPFSSAGYWFASGQRLSFPSASVAQDPSRRIAGTVQPNTFQKDCCSCING